MSNTEGHPILSSSRNNSGLFLDVVNVNNSSINKRKGDRQKSKSKRNFYSTNQLLYESNKNI